MPERVRMSARPNGDARYIVGEHWLARIDSIAGVAEHLPEINARQAYPQRPARKTPQQQHGGRHELKTVLLMGSAAVAAATLFLVQPVSAADIVKIGTLWPLTGNAAAAGQASKAAAELATEIINNAHPELANLPLAKDAGLPNLGGAKLELTFVDH